MVVENDWIFIRIIKVAKNKIVQFETIPAIKLGFSALSLKEVDIVNKYIDDNIDRLPDLSHQLVGQIKQDKRSAQPEFILTDEVPQQLGKFFIECAKTYAAEHPLTDSMKKNILLKKCGLYIAMRGIIIHYMNMVL